MELLLYHWHCILPLIIIVIAMFFMREKPQKDKQSSNTDQEVMKNE